MLSRKERRWCWAYAGMLALLTTLPYLLAYAAQGEEWRFSGFVFAVEDGNSYIAKMLLGSSGAWLFRTPYTAEPQQGVLAFLPYLLLGKLTAGQALHEQLVALFHIFRIGAIPLLVLATYRFVALFLDSARWRRWAVVIATAGGGLGWLLVLLGRDTWLGSMPLDVISPESFGFLSIYGIPHLVLSRALLLLALSAYLESGEFPRKAWMAGLSLLALALVQPLTVITAYAVIAGHQVVVLIGAWRRNDWAWWRPWLVSGFRSFIVPLPLVIYLGWQFLRDPYLQAWTSQNRILSPHPLHYLAAYGMLLPAVIVGAWRLLKRRQARDALPVAWVVLLPLLAYLPHNLQRRLPDGVWVAMAVLGAAGLAHWAGIRAKLRALAPLMLAMALPTSLLLLGGGFQVAMRPAEPAFLTREEKQAFDWLGSVAEGGEVVLASFGTGNALPAWAPVQVLIGHGPESANLDVLRPLVESFYDLGMDESQRRVFLAAHDFDYVVVGPRERALGDWDPGSMPELILQYAEGGYRIYAVGAP